MPIPGGTTKYPSPDASDTRIRVMVVDDSAMIRGMIARALEGDPAVRVVASVANGEVALATLKRTNVEVAVLDIEMPVMDGLTALPKLIAAQPGLQVIMASTLTRRNASSSLQALAAGAADYLPKPTSSTGLGAAGDFQRELLEKVKALGEVARRGRGAAPPRQPDRQVAAPPRRLYADAAVQLRNALIATPEVVAIGSSTGGPQALFTVLAKAAPLMPVPILITQHMPPTFTTILAEHISHTSGLPAAEGRDGEPVLRGRIYVAPGDFHMTVALDGTQKVIRLSKGPAENFCRPAVDPMLRGVASVYGRHALVVILTGMGQDGRRGAEAIIAAGGTVIAQDEPSSVVWGMPGAVATAGLCSAVLPLPDISPYIRKHVLRSAA
ncbi:MAG TPA: chemotaxis response regulator protein-glutamate methylesterase [Dongiaceae bacterium]|nr:chemotaxis response regulator protein-glutamate methylesterase [Dongiaceae bacterium]